MAHVHLIEGPVGSGKSTFARTLSARHAAPRLILDDWMTTLFRPDRPDANVMQWYIERKQRCIDQIFKVARDVVTAGSDVVLELGLIEQSSRLAMYDRLDAAACAYTVYVLDAPRDVRRERVRTRNRERGETFAMEVPDAFFELASDLWQAPDEFECEGRDVRFIAEDPR